MTVALTGDFGKPRPALVIQSDRFADHATVTVLLLTATLADAPLVRLRCHPTPENGLRKPSQIMVDRAMTVRRAKLGAPIGRLDEMSMRAVDRALALFFGFA